MTVTTFRGLPKPGKITPDVRAAIERARADAQAPLDGEVIPRRYRDGVRAYFDGLGDGARPGDGAREPRPPR